MTALLLAAMLLLGFADSALGHSGLVASDPRPDSTLGASPGLIRLTFSEEPEPSLSQIQVLGENGSPLQSGPPQPAPENPLVLTQEIPRLPKGVYTVTFKAVSAVDGHSSVGAYVFGVGTSPAGVDAVAPDSPESDTSWLELLGRWTLLLGLVALVGAAAAAVGRFGGSDGSDLRLALAGWAAAAIGLILLAVAQRRAAGTSIGDLLDTPVGEALVWRAFALALAGAALLFAYLTPEFRRRALGLGGVAAIGAIVAHVEAGHAGAGGWSTTITVTAQAAHFAAAGVWFGGLAALLLGIRGRASAAKRAAVRRYAVAALIALLVVLVTGTLRAIDELESLGDLVSTGYGRAVIAKVLLISLIAGLAYRNRRVSVSRASKDLEPLRRTSRLELGLATVALAVAAVLGSLAPAVAGPETGPRSLSTEGSDSAETVRVELETESDQPGPNTFSLQVEDYDSGDPVETERASLRFRPIDDPGVEPTTLELKPGSDGAFEATGDNLTFDGRWEVTVALEMADGAVEVPLELDLPLPSSEGFVSRLVLPDRPPQYDLEVGDLGYIRLRVDPQQAGPNRLEVICYSVFQNQMPIEHLVVTARAGEGEVRELDVSRDGPARFSAEAELEPGENTVRIVARALNGIRLRGDFELEASGG